MTVSAAVDALDVRTTGGTGDVALYARRGAVPTLSIAPEDGRSVTPGK